MNTRRHSVSSLGIMTDEVEVIRSPAGGALQGVWCNLVSPKYQRVVAPQARIRADTARQQRMCLRQRGVVRNSQDLWGRWVTRGQP